MSQEEYTPSMAGSGQFSRCAHCKKDPIVEGAEVYDGCLGKLDDKIVMNACCGHSDKDLAYIQFWDGSCIRGCEAIKFQRRLLNEQSI